jgi:hypothetical protein
MPLVDDQRSDRPSGGGFLGALGDLEEVQAARRLPGILVGLLLAIPIFLAAATLLAFVAVGLYNLLGPTSPIVDGLGIGWFGGSLAITAIAVRPLLRRLNRFLAGRNWPKIY